MTPATFKSCCGLLAVDDKPLSDPELAIAFCCTWRLIQHCKAGTREISPNVRNHLANAMRHGLLPETAKAIRERRASDGRRKS
jgi:hypothetical protein